MSPALLGWCSECLGNYGDATKARHEADTVYRSCLLLSGYTDWEPNRLLEGPHHFMLEPVWYKCILITILKARCHAQNKIHNYLTQACSNSG